MKPLLPAGASPLAASASTRRPNGGAASWTTLCAFALLAAAPARAGLVDTFSFAQGGYAGAIAPGASGALSGAFTGVVEADGTIRLADLRSITLAYTAGGTSLFGHGPATFFSFIPGSDSTLDLEAPIGAGGVACVGAVAAFGFGQCGAGGVNGEVAGLDATQALPVLTLVSSVVELPPQPIPLPGPVLPPQPTPQPVPTPGPTNVPEPASLALLGAGLLGLGFVGRGRRLESTHTASP